MVVKFKIKAMHRSDLEAVSALYIVIYGFVAHNKGCEYYDIHLHIYLERNKQ